MTDSIIVTGVSRTWRYIRPAYSPIMPSNIALMLIDKRMSAASVVKTCGPLRSQNEAAEGIEEHENDCEYLRRRDRSSWQSAAARSSG